MTGLNYLKNRDGGNKILNDYYNYRILDIHNDFLRTEVLAIKSYTLEGNCIKNDLVFDNDNLIMSSKDTTPYKYMKDYFFNLYMKELKTIHKFKMIKHYEYKLISVIECRLPVQEYTQEDLNLLFTILKSNLD